MIRKYAREAVARFDQLGEPSHPALRRAAGLCLIGR